MCNDPHLQWACQAASKRKLLRTSPKSSRYLLTFPKRRIVVAQLWGRAEMLAALLLAGQAIAPPQPIHLICVGAGTAAKLSSTYGSFYDNRGNSAWGQVLSRRDRPFDDQVNVEISSDGQGRIRMPRAMLPVIRGGKDGWFELGSIKMTDSEITAAAEVNFMNKPRVRLDRITGAISISGKAGDYSGECQAYDPAAVPRKF
jgi:hypothetical protein